MNPLIHLSHQSPMSMAPGGLSSASRVHTSLSHGSLSVTQGSNKRSNLVVSRPLYVKCTLERFSEGPKMKEENDGNKKKNNNSIMSGVGRASLVMACVLGAITLSGKMKPNPTNIAYASLRQDKTKQSSTSQIADRDRDRKMNESLFGKAQIDANDVKALKLLAMALSMRPGYRDVAETILSHEYETFKDDDNSYLLSIALIELLLDQGKYEKAKEKIDKLVPYFEGLDVPKKIYLLKAIAESENNKREEAKKSWKQYLGESSSPSAYDLKKFS